MEQIKIDIEKLLIAQSERCLIFCPYGIICAMYAKYGKVNKLKIRQIYNETLKEFMECK